MNPLDVRPQSGPASTLAEIEALLKQAASGTSDITNLPVVTHVATGVRFRVGPMSRPNHEAWLSLRFQEDQRHEQSGAAKSGAPLVRGPSDEYLLTHAVWSEDGQNLTPELCKLLMTGARFGPSTYALLEAAAEQNPPRSQLVGEIVKIWGATASNLIMMRVLERAGLLILLRDRLVGSEEEKAVAIQELDKWAESLTFWEANFECEAIARDTGLAGLYKDTGRNESAADSSDNPTSL